MHANESGRASRAAHREGGGAHAVSLLWGFAEATVFFVVPDVWISRQALSSWPAALRSCGPAYAALGRLIDLPPVRPLAAVGYGLVARYRYKLPGGTDACRMPQ